MMVNKLKKMEAIVQALGKTINKEWILRIKNNNKVSQAQNYPWVKESKNHILNVVAYTLIMDKVMMIWYETLFWALAVQSQKLGFSSFWRKNQKSQFLCHFTVGQFFKKTPKINNSWPWAYFFISNSG